MDCIFFLHSPLTLYPIKSLLAVWIASWWHGNMEYFIGCPSRCLTLTALAPSMPSGYENTMGRDIRKYQGASSVCPRHPTYIRSLMQVTCTILHHLGGIEITKLCDVLLFNYIKSSRRISWGLWQEVFPELFYPWQNLLNIITVTAFS